MKRIRIPVIVGSIGLGVALSALGWYYFSRSFLQPAYQVSTAIGMREISRKIDALIANGVYDENAFQSAILSVTSGKDSWGRPLIFDLRRCSEGVQYVLISTGRDGLLDYPMIPTYYSLDEEWIKGQFDRDTVFRNGKKIVGAGK